MGREKAKSQPTTKQCTVCSSPHSSERSRCPTCYSYWRKHGTDRPKQLCERKAKPAWCEVCGDPNVEAQSKCKACYMYWRRHKKKRPRFLWDTDCRCKNCKIPLRSLGRWASGTQRWRSGFCEACIQYKDRTGKARPKHLWGDGPLGFCECGYPAVALVEDIPVCVRHKE